MRHLRLTIFCALAFVIVQHASAEGSKKLETSRAVTKQVRKLIEEKKETESFDKQFKEIVAFGPLAIEPLLELGGKEKLENHQRWTAIRAVGKIGDERAVEGLVALLKDPYPDVRMAALRALGDLKSESALPMIRDRAENDPAMFVRDTAVAVLGRFKSRESIVTFEKVLADERNFIKGKSLFIRRKAVTALGDMEERAAVPALIKALDDKDEAIAPLAIASLEKITGQKFRVKGNTIATREKWKSWWAEEYKKIPVLQKQGGEEAEEIPSDVATKSGTPEESSKPVQAGVR